MTDSSDSNNSGIITAEPAEIHSCTPKFDVFATGVATGVVVTAIVETGKGAVGILVKNPFVVLGAGIAAGYFAHKYRKEIILSSNQVAKQGKDFVSRQKKTFSELLAQREES